MVLLWREWNVLFIKNNKKWQQKKELNFLSY